MGTQRKILFATITLAIAFSYQTYRNLSKPHERPELGKQKKGNLRTEFMGNIH